MVKLKRFQTGNLNLFWANCLLIGCICIWFGENGTLHGFMPVYSTIIQWLKSIHCYCRLNVKYWIKSAFY